MAIELETEDLLPPLHPGEILREEFMVPLGLTPYAVAKACGVPRTRIVRIVREKTPVTADTALRLGGYFGMIRSPEDCFRTSYHQPARRLSEADFRIAKQSVGNRMNPQVWINLQGDYELRRAQREIGTEIDRIRPLAREAA